nr:PREDICTED: P2Y purinoceptor 14-like [Lepisosteus oculatus]
MPVMDILVNESTKDGLCDYEKGPIHTALTIAYSLVFAAGIVLNSLTLWVSFCHTHNKCCVTVYLKNLAIADFLLVLSLPVKIVDYSMDSEGVRKTYCTLVASAFYLNIYASILFMEHIGVNRYLKIVRPLENHVFQTVRAAKYISLGTWGLLLIIASTFAVLSLETFWSSLNSTAGQSKMCYMVLSPAGKQFYVFIHFLSIVLFIFVLASLSFFYFQTAKRLKATKHAANKKLQKSKKNISVLITVFCVCFVPYHLLRVLYLLTKNKVIDDCDAKRVIYYLKEFTIVLSSLNACLDPFIYFIFCKAFRAKIGLLKFLRRNEKLSADHPKVRSEVNDSVYDFTTRPSSPSMAVRESLSIQGS